VTTTDSVPFTRGGHVAELLNQPGSSGLRTPAVRTRTESFYRLGGCTFRLGGTGGFVEHVRAECAPLEIPAAAALDIDFNFQSYLPPMPGYSIAAPLKIGDGRYEAVCGRVAYQVDPGLAGYRVYVAKDVKRKHRVPDPVRRFHDWNFHTPEENAAKDFIYGVLGYLAQIVNLERGTSYLHACSFERNGRGIALMAWRGIGKTTAMLKLVNEHKWKYLSDDLAVLGPPRTLSRSAQRIQLYAYNLIDEEMLTQRIFSRRTYWDRSAWAFRKWRYGLAGVRRRIAAEDLFGAHAVAHSAPLVVPVLMERADTSDFECATMSSSELARRAAHIMLTELSPFVEISAALKAFDPSTELPGPDLFLARTIEVLDERFAGLHARRVRVPIGARPAALAAYLHDLLG
jgi:hypothetical protein